MTTIKGEKPSFADDDLDVGDDPWREKEENSEAAFGAPVEEIIVEAALNEVSEHKQKAEGNDSVQVLEETANISHDQLSSEKKCIVLDVVAEESKETLGEKQLSSEKEKIQPTEANVTEAIVLPSILNTPDESPETTAVSDVRSKIGGFRKQQTVLGANERISRAKVLVKNLEEAKDTPAYEKAMLEMLHATKTTRFLPSWKSDLVNPNVSLIGGKFQEEQRQLLKRFTSEVEVLKMLIVKAKKDRRFNNQQERKKALGQQGLQEALPEWAVVDSWPKPNEGNENRVNSPEQRPRPEPPGKNIIAGGPFQRKNATAGATFERQNSSQRPHPTAATAANRNPNQTAFVAKSAKTRRQLNLKRKRQRARKRLAENNSSNPVVPGVHHSFDHNRLTRNSPARPIWDARTNSNRSLAHSVVCELDRIDRPNFTHGSERRLVTRHSSDRRGGRSSRPGRSSPERCDRRSWDRANRPRYRSPDRSIRTNRRSRDRSHRGDCSPNNSRRIDWRDSPNRRDANNMNMELGPAFGRVPDLVPPPLPFGLLGQMPGPNPMLEFPPMNLGTGFAPFPIGNLGMPFGPLPPLEFPLLPMGGLMPRDPIESANPQASGNYGNSSWVGAQNSEMVPVNQGDNMRSFDRLMSPHGRRNDDDDENYSSFRPRDDVSPRRSVHDTEHVGRGHRWSPQQPEINQGIDEWMDADVDSLRGRSRNKSNMRKDDEKRSHSRGRHAEPSRVVTMAIAHVNYPSSWLTQEDAQKIQADLLRAITREGDGCGPRFDGVSFDDGCLKVRCQPESVSWLENQFVRNGFLKVILMGDNPNRCQKAVAWLKTIGMDDPRAMLSTLKAQNQDLRTEEWRVWGVRKLSDGYKLLLEIDLLSVEQLKEMNLRPFFGFGRAKFKLWTGGRSPRGHSMQTPRSFDEFMDTSEPE